MDRQRVCPTIIVPGEPARELRRLQRVHTTFDENGALAEACLHRQGQPWTAKGTL